MSFHPVTMHQFRCDGDTTRGQCWNMLMCYEDPEDDESPEVPAVTTAQSIEGYRSWFAASCWLVTKDDRILCPEHVASMEHWAKAAVEGLPFEEAGAA